MHKKLTYTSICITIALILSYVKIFEMPTGGSITACSMLFITLIGYWFGPKMGITGGIVFGLLQLLSGGYVVHPIQLVLDYPLAFGMLGLSGFFRNSNFGLYKGYILGVVARWFCSFLSGVIFFSSTMPNGVNTIFYSVLYNISYIAPETIITLIIISIPSFKNTINRIKTP